MSHVHQPLRYGVNYVPRKNWWYVWQDWDRGEITEDLHAIAELGFDHIRAHCLWPVFQPDVGYISPAAVQRFTELLEIADGANLDVVLSLLDGWLSGWAFFPAFVHSPRGMKSIYTDPVVVQAERELCTTLIRAAGGNRRLLGIDLGNEINVLEHFVPRPTREEGDSWARDMFSCAESTREDLLLTNGVDHNPWYRNTVFSRTALARSGSHTSVHAWVKFTGALELFPPGHIGREAIARYAVELAAAYATTPARPVWLQEFGASGEWLPEHEIIPLMEATLNRVEKVPELWGVTWWCSHDIDQSHRGFSGQEYDMGLLDLQNRPKPMGVHFRNRVRTDNNARQVFSADRVALVFDESSFDDPAERDPTMLPETSTLLSQKLVKQFMHYLAEHENLCLLHRSRAADSTYLEERGITRVIDNGGLQ